MHEISTRLSSSLKLRCDRKVPCETCLKRGCASICPNGSLTTGRGNRLVLANTEELHNKIEVMSARIRELEEALQQTHSQKFDPQHSLLAGTIADVSPGRAEEGPGPSDEPYPPASRTEADAIIDAFGTLTIGTRGETTFMSSTARAEPPIKQGINLSLEDVPHLDRRVLDAWLPDTELAPINEELRKVVMSHLPPLSEAIRLCEIYLEWGKTLWNPLTRHELFDGVVGSVYRAGSEFVGVRFLLIRYSHVLHPDLHSARFNLAKPEVQKRSALFWQLFLVDTWISFYAGRPPNVSLDWIDTPYAEDEYAVIGEKGAEMSYGMLGHSLSWRYARLLHHVLVKAFGTTMPTYRTILELDRKIRDFRVSPHLQPICDTDEDAFPLSVKVQRYYLLLCKEFTLLNLHRRYFSQALQDQPSDFLKHKYGPSVMAMYRSAWRLIISLSQGVKTIPHVFERMSIFWSHAFSAAIVMCMIVTRAPTSNMAASSLHELDAVYEVFRIAAPTTKPAMILLDSITKIWRKGHEVMDHPDSEGLSTLSRSELDRLGGGSTCLISEISAPSPSSSFATSNSSPEVGPSPPSMPQCNGNPCLSDNRVPAECIHPRIMQDMRIFDGFGTPQISAFSVPHVSSKELVQAMSDVQFGSQNAFGAEIYTGQNQGLNNFYPAQPFGSPEGFQEAPVLDPAWQSFVEQLGF
ncbi:hypothetical protein F5I97DRAFT_1937249 [Phlebopus sp. FC_14]|nr:hypothetical protein F5I97DRAFT_1937249 [Phlebopus sp. FC_14]